jgi:hypothetical protein
MPTPIFYQRRSFDAPHTPMTGSELRQLFAVPATDDLFHAHGNRTEGPKIGDGDPVDLHNGDHFTSIPSDISGGAPSAELTLTPRVAREVTRIREELFPLETKDAAGSTALVVTAEDEAWTPRPLRILVRVPTLYPDEKPDLLFLAAGVGWSGGGIPRVMGILSLADEIWTQISWHWNGAYAPANDNLVRFVSSIRKFLADPRV